MFEKRTNLSLKDAIKSGRPFKRYFETEWRDPSTLQWNLTVEDIFAVDYMVKKEVFKARVYVSPDKKQITLDSAKADWNWEAYDVSEEE